MNKHLIKVHYVYHACVCFRSGLLCYPWDRRHRLLYNYIFNYNIDKYKYKMVVVHIIDMSNNISNLSTVNLEIDYLFFKP